jgi:uncharacterized membrane protein
MFKIKKVMKKHLIILLGHILLMALHYYFMKYKGHNSFQVISFAFIHYVWSSIMVKRIYGLK